MATTSTAGSTDRLRQSETWLLVALVIVCRVLTTRSCPLYDDAFITYRYARNLADGHGLVFNPGASWEPILGTTTPAYALLLAGFARMGAALDVASIAINIACDAVTTWLILRALLFRRVPAIVCVATFAALPFIGRISVGGMEAPVFAMLAVLAGSSFERRALLLAGSSAAIACTVRPEGVLLVGVLTLASWRRPRDLLRLLAPVAVVGLVSTGILTAFYGSFVPQSVRAKSQMNAWEVQAEIWSRYGAILRQAFLPHPALAVALPALAIGLWQALRTSVTLRVFSCFALAITMSYLAARPHTWGWYFYVPLTAWAVWLGLGAEAIRAWLARRTGFALWMSIGPRWTWGAAMLIALAVLAVAVRYPSPVVSRVYEPMHAWARETSLREPTARVLAADIGALGYAWNGTVLDSEGLTWPKALEYRFPNAIIRAERPEFLMIVAERPRLEAFFSDRDVREDYVAIGRFSATGETDLDPDVNDISPTWVQDYLIYERKSD